MNVKDILGILFGGTLLTIIILFVVVFSPFVALFALNTLFPSLDLAYSIDNLIAMFILILVFNPGCPSSSKK